MRIDVKISGKYWKIKLGISPQKEEYKDKDVK